VASWEEPPEDVPAELARGLPIAAFAANVVHLEEFTPGRWRERQRFELGH
jgi:hypothetical protein